MGPPPPPPAPPVHASLSGSDSSLPIFSRCNPLLHRAAHPRARARFELKRNLKPPPPPPRPPRQRYEMTRPETNEKNGNFPICRVIRGIRVT